MPDNNKKYNGDNTTLVDIRRRHIKEDQTDYSADYAIARHHVSNPVTGGRQIWREQPARANVERLIFIKNDILRQIMEFACGDCVGSADYGKNCQITFGVPEELARKTDWNENFDQAVADNFGMPSCTGFLGISIQMLNCICETECGCSITGELDEKNLRGYSSALDTSDRGVKTFGYGQKFVCTDEYPQGISVEDWLAKKGKNRFTDTSECRNLFFEQIRYRARQVINAGGTGSLNQNQVDALVHRSWSSPGPALEMARWIASGKSPRYVYDNWRHLAYCKAKSGGGRGNQRGWADGYTRNCEEMRNWFLNGPDAYWVGRTEGSYLFGAEADAPHIDTPPNLAAHGFDIGKALGAFRNLHRGSCARVVREMLEAGGMAGVIKKNGHPLAACWYHTKGYLKKYGFTHIDTLYDNSGRTSYDARPGDVAVMFDSSGKEYPAQNANGKPAYGHICIYFGPSGGWRSDFVQKGPNPYGQKHPTWIYRLI